MATHPRSPNGRSNADLQGTVAESRHQRAARSTAASNTCDEGCTSSAITETTANPSGVVAIWAATSPSIVVAAMNCSCSRRAASADRNNPNR